MAAILTIHATPPPRGNLARSASLNDSWTCNLSRAHLRREQIEQLLRLGADKLGDECSVATRCDGIEEVRSIPHDRSKVEKQNPQRGNLRKSELTGLGQMEIVLAVPAVRRCRYNPPQDRSHRCDQIHDPIRRPPRVGERIQLLEADELLLVVLRLRRGNLAKEVVDPCFIKQTLSRNSVALQVAGFDVKTQPQLLRLRGLDELYISESDKPLGIACLCFSPDAMPNHNLRK